MAASRVWPYAEMAEAGAALALDEGSWEWGLRRLVTEPALRRGMVEAADGLLTARFGWDRLGRSVEAALDAVRVRIRAVA